MIGNIDFWAVLWKLTAWALLLWAAHLALVTVSPRWRMWLWRLGASGCFAVLLLGLLPSGLSWTIEYTQTSAALAAPVAAHIEEAPVKPGQAAPSHRSEQRSVQAPPVNPLPLPPSALLPPESVLGSMSTSTAPAETVPPLPPAPQHSSQAPVSAVKASPATINWGWFGIVAGYLLVVGLLAVRMIVGQLRANRLIHRAQPVDESVRRMAEEFAGRLNLSPPTVLRSADLSVPAVAGWQRPCILIPDTLVQCSDNETDLRAGLAHEIAHVAGRDLFWNRAMQVCRLLLWWHPCYWRMPEAHRAACERVCDLTAADLLGDREQYRISLARIALLAFQRKHPQLLSMASRPEILDRLKLLSSDMGIVLLGRRGRLAGTLVLLLACLIGTLSVRWSPVVAQTPEKPSTESTPVEQKEEQPLPPFELTVLKEEDGTPLADTEVKFWNHNKLTKHLRTDEQGKVLLDWPPPSQRDLMLRASFSFLAKHSGRVPYYVQIGRVTLDNLPQDKTIRMQQGIIIGGIIEDESGNPVVGAETSILVPATETSSSIHFQLLDMKTGADGRWLLDSAPEPVTGLTLRIEHPQYLNAQHTVQAGTDIRYRLERGWNIRGKVTGADGNPVEKAIVHVGHDRFGSGRPTARTDADGQYELTGLQKADTMITVTTEQHAPEMRDVKYRVEPAEVDFQLAPGHLLIVKVVDASGKPIPKVWFAPDTWRGHRSLEWRIDTDENGEARWQGAPSDAVQFDILKQGYTSLRNQALIAREEPYVLTLHPIRQFELTVLDAETLLPIPELKGTFGSKFPGQDRVYWMEYEGFSGRRGKASASYNEPQEPLFLRVEAPGYEPWISPALPVDETKMELQILLKAGAGPTGLVLTADGSPAQNADVHLLTEQNGMQFSQKFRPHGGAQHVKCAADGRFQLQPLDEPDRPALLSIVHESGYLEVPLEQVTTDVPLKLQPWCRIEATLRDGETPLPGETVVVQINGPERKPVQVFSYGIQAKADANGVAVIDRCPPFDAFIGRQLTIPMPNGGYTSTLASSYKVSLQPGETVRLTLGAEGRAVTGRIVMPPNPPIPHRWAVNEFGRLNSAGLSYSDPRMKTFAFRINDDGTFRIPGVVPGEYQFQLRLSAEPNPALCGTGDNLGNIARTFEVPEGEGEFDLGDIPGEWTRFLLPGDAAPDFVAFDQNRELVRLRDCFKNHFCSLARRLDMFPIIAI